MSERFVSTSKVAFGAPHTFGWGALLSIGCQRFGSLGATRWQKGAAPAWRTTGTDKEAVAVNRYCYDRGRGWPLIDAISDRTGRPRVLRASAPRRASFRFL
jgi:hypothetical protein